MISDSRLGPGELLRVADLRTHFPIRSSLLKKSVGQIRALDGISFAMSPGETLALVGESGCGKTTLGRTMLRAVEPTEGSFIFRDRNGKVLDIFHADAKTMIELRREMQFVFQDPFSSLNPRMTVEQIVGEPYLVHKVATGKAARERVAVLLEKVGLRAEYGSRYPHAFSGGQRQRIGIARAIALNPRLIICDEATSALDVSVQAQILNLLQDMQKELGLAYLFISHDLSVVEHLATRVAVMYVGRIVEIATVRDIFNNPKHPYTEALLSAVPRPDPSYRSNRILLAGEVADPSNPPNGCYFHPRCRHAQQICRGEYPAMQKLADDHGGEREVACHLAGSLKLRGVDEH